MSLRKKLILGLACVAASMFMLACAKAKAGQNEQVPRGVQQLKDIAPAGKIVFEFENCRGLPPEIGGKGRYSASSLILPQHSWATDAYSKTRRDAGFVRFAEALDQLETTCATDLFRYMRDVIPLGQKSQWEPRYYCSRFGDFPGRYVSWAQDAALNPLLLEYAGAEDTHMFIRRQAVIALCWPGNVEVIPNLLDIACDPGAQSALVKVVLRHLPRISRTVSTKQLSQISLSSAQHRDVQDIEYTAFRWRVGHKSEADRKTAKSFIARSVAALDRPDVSTKEGDLDQVQCLLDGLALVYLSLGDDRSQDIAPLVQLSTVFQAGYGSSSVDFTWLGDGESPTGDSAFRLFQEEEANWDRYARSASSRLFLQVSNWLDHEYNR